ncbi:MAG: D-glycerate dehydrogenase [Firmicutes bacterium]|nr:D-glycerate dehydrogenase [Bacillota bacterium]
MAHIVVITRRVAPEAVSVLEASATVQMHADSERGLSPAQLLEAVRDADGLLCMLSDRIDAQVLDAAKRLRVVANLAVGYDNIDLQTAARRGIQVTNTPDLLTQATADLALALMLATARRLPQAAAYLRQGHWLGWSPDLFTGQDVYGATLGIVGLGRIGHALAERARGLNMQILYAARSPKTDAERMYAAQRCELDELLRLSDFVVLLTPLTPATRGLIGWRELRLMKPTACLINIGRGPVVDEDALVRALREGVIWGAGLDVFEHEPIRPDHPLLECANAVLLPHIGSASIATRRDMALLCARNILAVLSGEPPLTPVTTR